MGSDPSKNDGFISRINLDGSHDIAVVKPGVAGFTPKQCSIDEATRTLYWCDREGMRIWRAKLPAPATSTSSSDAERLDPELLYQSYHGDEQAAEHARQDLTNHCVGIAVDSKRGRIYWTQKGPSKGGKGRLFAAGVDVPQGEQPSSRGDVVCLIKDLPEPIDLEVDHARNVLYKTDRGAEPRGNTVSRVDLNVFAGQGIEGVKPDAVSEEILVEHLHEAIGLALDLDGGKMYFTDLGGSVYQAALDGSGKREVAKGVGDLTGICFVRV